MSRIELLRNLLKNNEAALIEAPKNRRYFTNMNTSNGMLLITQEKALFFTDFRYITAAKSQVDRSFDVKLFEGTHAETLKAYLPREIERIFFEGYR